MTSDAEKAKSFYGALFGWTYQTGDEEKYGGYITAWKDGKSVAGLMQKQEDQGAWPDMWSTYLRSEDAAATVKAATGATAVRSTCSPWMSPSRAAWQ